jgi:hypothetical protein
MDANEQVRGLHDRMPVIVDKKDYGTWLDLGPGKSPEIQELLKPYGGELVLEPVSTRVNSPVNDDARCLSKVRAYPNNHELLRFLCAAAFWCWDSCVGRKPSSWILMLSPVTGACRTICGRSFKIASPSIRIHTVSEVAGHGRRTAYAWKPSSSCFAPVANGRPWMRPCFAQVPQLMTASKNGSKRECFWNCGRGACWPTKNSKGSTGPG